MIHSSANMKKKNLRRGKNTWKCGMFAAMDPQSFSGFFVDLKGDGVA